MPVVSGLLLLTNLHDVTLQASVAGLDLTLYKADRAESRFRLRISHRRNLGRNLFLARQ